MKPARVLHVIDSLHLGGAQEVILNIVSAADTRSFHHEVATLHGRGIYWDRLSEAGITLHSLSPHKYIPIYMASLASLLIQGRFDIVHCHLIASNLLAKPMAAAFGVPVVINHDHTNDPQRGDRRWLLSLDAWANRYASHIIAVSSSCRDFLTEKEHIPESKVTLVRNAIDLKRFSPGRIEKDTARSQLNLPRSTPLVAGVGRLHPQKNFSGFLDIAASVIARMPETHFVIAGTGPEESALRAKAARLGLAQNVTFAGYVADTRQIYAACDVLLMPSRFEGLPMTLLEAMALRTPVVASRLDGIAEVITHGQDGLMAEPDDTTSFAEHVLSILDSSELALRMGNAAHESIASKHDAVRMVRTIESHYTALLP